MRNDTSREADAVSREDQPHSEDNGGADFPRPLGVSSTEADFYLMVARSAQATIEKALAGRDRGEVVKRIQAGIDVAEAGNR